MDWMQIVKLGGSVITVKGSPEKEFRPEVVARLASEMRRADKEISLVHGAGCYGHNKAKEYGLKQGRNGDGTIQQMFEVQMDVLELNCLVLEKLFAADIPAVMIPTHATMYFRDGRPELFQSEIYRALLGRDFMPVSYGDVVMDTELDFTICSGDDVMVELARSLKPKMAHFVTNVDCIYRKYDDESTLVKRTTADEGEALLKELGTNTSGEDVTGGIRKKLEAMIDVARLGVPSKLFNGGVPDNLYNALLGNDITCTFMEAD
jgi:isopentenyl phosphate kinase